MHFCTESNGCIYDWSYFTGVNAFWGSILRMHLLIKYQNLPGCILGSYSANASWEKCTRMHLLVRHRNTPECIFWSSIIMHLSIKHQNAFCWSRIRMLHRMHFVVRHSKCILRRIWPEWEECACWVCWSIIRILRIISITRIISTMRIIRILRSSLDRRYADFDRNGAILTKT